MIGALVVSAALIIKQPDMGTAMVLSCTAFGILFMSGVELAPLHQGAAVLRRHRRACSPSAAPTAGTGSCRS